MKPKICPNFHLIYFQFSSGKSSKKLRLVYTIHVEGIQDLCIHVERIQDLWLWKQRCFLFYKNKDLCIHVAKKFAEKIDTFMRFRSQ